MIKKYFPLLLVLISATATVILLLHDLKSFPPYFFCDEAISGLDAEYLIRTGRDTAGVSWPIVFRGLGEYALSSTVYFQIPFNYIFGMGEESVRLRTACTSFFGICVLAGFVWSRGYSRLAWVPFFIFSISPFWYLHSRTGFEYITSGVFYLLFFVFYIQALGQGNPKWLFGAAASAAICFYSYTPARGWIACAVVMLGLCNWRFHYNKKVVSISAAVLGLLMLLPFLWFAFSDPGAANKRLEAVGFGEFMALSLPAKFTHICEGYFTVLNPQYWFTMSGTMEGVGWRHFIPGLNAIPLWLSFFFSLGFFIFLYKGIEITQRTFLCFLFAVPFAASAVTVNHERTMAVGMLYLVICIIGVVCSLDRLSRAVKHGPWVIPLVALSLSVLYQYFFNSYVHGKSIYKYDNYGFYGTQSGAFKLYEWISKNAKKFDVIYLSQGTFNAPEVMAEFYLPTDIQSKVINAFSKKILDGSHELKKPELWIVSCQEIDEWRSLGYPINIKTIAVLSDPTGRPLHEVVELSVQPTYSEWRKIKITALENRRKILEVSQVKVGAEQFLVSHPPIASGNVDMLFSNQSGVVVRVDEINPAHFIFRFSSRILSEISITLTHTSKAIITFSGVSNGVEELIGQKEFVSMRGDSPQITFPPPLKPTSELRMVVYLPDAPPDESPHLERIVIR